MGQWCARSIQTGPGSWCVQREAYPTARRSFNAGRERITACAVESRTNGTTPSLLWILCQAAIRPNNTHQIKAATDFHSKGGEIQNDVWELTLGTYLGKTHENGNNRHLAQDV